MNGGKEKSCGILEVYHKICIKLVSSAHSVLANAVSYMCMPYFFTFAENRHLLFCKQGLGNGGILEKVCAPFL